MNTFLLNTSALRWLLMYSANTLSILAMRTLILIMEDSMWLQLVYLLNEISFCFVECLFQVDGALTLANYNSKCYKIYSLFSLPLYRFLYSHYGKFTALQKLISVVLHWPIKSSKNFPRNHAVPGLFLKNWSGNEGG